MKKIQIIYKENTSFPVAVCFMGRYFPYEAHKATVKGLNGTTKSITVTW